MTRTNPKEIQEIQGFQPYKKPEKIAVVVFKKEAVLISKLRRHSYGQFVVHKANGIITRLEIKDSQLIDEDTPVDLE